MSHPTLRLNSGYPDSSPYLRDAVKELQRDLQRWGFDLPATGLFGPVTLSAVRSFQHKQGIEDDGIVGPGTWRLLTSTKATNIGSSFRESVPPAPTVGGSTDTGQFFPLARIYQESWTRSPGCFGANRSNGSRAHAGADIYAPLGTWIHAIAPGTVRQGPYSFYAHTYALEIDHVHFVARYGEIQRDSPVRAGDKVKAGQRIGRIGHLVGIKAPSDMLHLELYAGNEQGPLTVTGHASAKRKDGVPYKRRADLLDPTSYVNNWRNNLPVD
jgi:murein DD-endopeptidase MepM/ murein hydrolase activator NlpD